MSKAKLDSQAKPNLTNRPSESTSEPTKEPPKKTSWWKRCCCGCLVIVGLFILYLLFAVVRSGYWQLPVLTPLFYGSDPEPIRQVEATDPEVFNGKLEKAVVNDEQELIASEGEVTGFLTSDDSQFNIALDSEQAEIFTQLKMEGREKPIFVTLELNPEIKDGILIPNLKGARIGKLGVPVFLSNIGLNYYLGSMSENESISKIDEIELGDKEITIKADIRGLLTEETIEYGPTGQETCPTCE